MELTCVKWIPRSIDSGYGCSHVQRPNKNGCHLLAYNLKCRTLTIRHESNIPSHVRDAQIWFFNPRPSEVEIDHSAYIQKSADPAAAKLFRWVGVDQAGVTFSGYQRLTGNDADSVRKGE